MGLDILEELFDKKVLDLIRLFFSEHQKDFYLRELAKETKVSLASTFRIVQRLAKLGLIEQKDVGGKFKVYRLADNENTRFLGQVVKREKQALQVFVTRAKLLEGLNTIYLQGTEEKDRANIIVTGEKVDSGAIKEICAAVKEQYQFIVIPLLVTEEQFSQMSQMYPIKKRVLFSKDNLIPLPSNFPQL